MPLNYYLKSVSVLLLILACHASSQNKAAEKSFIGKWQFDQQKSWNSKEAKKLLGDPKGEKRLQIYFSLLRQLKLEISRDKFSSSYKINEKSQQSSMQYTIVKKDSSGYYLKIGERFARLKLLDENTLLAHLNLDNTLRVQEDAPPVILSRRK